MPNQKKGQSMRAVTKGQERLGSNPYDEKEVTRKKVDGPIIYQRELRKNNPQFSQLPMSDMTLIRGAREGWANLKPQQREKYDIMAKQENAMILQKSGVTWQKDMFGRSLTTEQEKQRRQTVWEQEVERQIEQLVSGPREEVISKDFHLITVNVFLNTAGAKRPEDVFVVLAEITLLSFSIKSGRKTRFSFFPEFGEPPAGHQADMIDSIDDHGIPVGKKKCIERLKATDVTRAIRRFVGDTGDDCPPLFTKTTEVTKTRLGLAYIYDMAGVECPWNDDNDLGKIYPFEKLTAAMTNRGIDLCGADPVGKIPLRTAVTHWTDQPVIPVGSECCEFHDTIDKSLICSQAQSMACLWWCLNLCAGYYDVNITDNHVHPLIRERTLRRVAEEQESMIAGNVWQPEPAPAPQTDPRPLPRGRGRGLGLEEASPPRLGGRGRGRGGGLRGRLRKNLD